MQKPDMARVLGLVSFRIYPTHMGGQKGVANFYEALQQHADVMLALSRDNVDSSRLPMKKLLYPNKKIYRNLGELRKVRELIREFRPDVLIAEHSYTGWLAWILHRKTGLPFIIHSHNIESRRFQKMNRPWWKIYQVYEGWIHRKADHSFFISDEDRDHAIKHFRLQPSDCSIITYGVQTRPEPRERREWKKQLGFDPQMDLLLFNGTLDYEPNYEAVITLIEKVEPLLRKKLHNFQILVTGNRAPRELAGKMMQASNLQYSGYVEDVDAVYQAADVFINPVANDTGVKTKLIEALANHCTTVSTEAGAAGLRRDLCADKLSLTPDGNWEAFVDAIIHAVNQHPTETPGAFFDYYLWDNIAGRAAKAIAEVIA